MKNIKKWYNELIYKAEIDSHRHRKQTYGDQGERVGRSKLGAWD